MGFQTLIFVEAKTNEKQMATNLCFSALGMDRTDLVKNTVLNGDYISVSAKIALARDVILGLSNLP